MFLFQFIELRHVSWNSGHLVCYSATGGRLVCYSATGGRLVCYSATGGHLVCYSATGGHLVCYSAADDVNVGEWISYFWCISIEEDRMNSPFTSFFFFSFYLYQGFVQNFPIHVSKVLWSTYTGFALSVWYIIGCSGTPLETLGISHWKCTNSNLFGGWSSKIMFTLPLWEIIQDHPAFNTLRLRQNSRHIPDNIFKWIFLNENIWILSLFLGVQLVIFQHWFR